MKKSVFVFLFAAAAVISSQASAQVTDSTKKDSTKTDTVKKTTSTSANSAPSQSADVVQAIAGSGYNTVLTSAIKSSGISEALDANEKYTIFAPNDKAFSDNKAKVEPLTKDAAKEQKVIKRHIVKGEFTKDDIIKALSASKDRSTSLTTVDGDKLTLKINEQKHLEISDASGNKAEVTVFDLKATNGVAHVVDNILLN